METFHLDIKDRVRADLDPLRLLQVSCEFFFISVLDLKEPVQDFIVVFECKQLPEFIGVLFISLPDRLVQESGETRIAVQQPPAERNAVCLIIELLRIDLIEVVQLGIFQDLCVQRSDAVDAEPIVDVNMRHVHGIIPVNDGNALVLKFSPYLVVQDLNDRHKLRNYFLKIRNRPFLQRFRKDGVVCVSTCLRHYVYRVIHVHSPCCEQADQFRDHHGRMGVIDLDHRVVRQVIQSTSLCHALIQDKLRARADHEILLVDTQEPSLLVAVVRVEE